MTNTDYDELLSKKLRAAQADGFEPYEIAAPLFDWQRLVVKWAIRRGRAALFEECITGDTLINTPNGNISVKCLHELGKPVRVFSITPSGVEISLATQPWVNGFGDVFEISLGSGRKIKASASHRFLTDTGWTPVSSLKIGEQLQVSDAARLRSISGRIQKAHDEDDLSSSKTVRDFPGNYSRDFCPCGEPPRLPSSISQESAPSPVDAHEHTPFLWKGGGMEHVLKCIHPGQYICRHSTKDLQRLSETHSGAVSGCRVFSESLRLFCLRGQRSSQSQLPGFPSSLAIKSTASSQGEMSMAFQFSYGDTITAIRYVGKDTFYDLHVPGNENYLANGIWSHNCGLGKTAQQLEWARQVAMHTGGEVLILCPLAVAEQTVDEGKKFGIRVNHAREAKHIVHGVNITNYQRIDKFDEIDFSGVVLDESSILKHFVGKTRRMLTERFKSTRFKLCCTATPSPNDFTELGSHAEFLGVCSQPEMLATYFINDTFDTGTWRLKGHSIETFWRWVAAWAACVTKPSDLGFSDEGYDLPPVKTEIVTVKVDHRADAETGELFRTANASATNLHREMRRTMNERVAAAAEIVNSTKEEFVVWTESNEESELLAKSIPEAVEVTGSDKDEHKEERIRKFIHGEARVLVTKSSIAGFGLNLQFCRNDIYVGMTHSFERFYQAGKRIHRFGQNRPINRYLVQADTEDGVMATIMRKQEQHETMRELMKFTAEAIKGEQKFVTMNTDIQEENGEGWTMFNGDCVRVAREEIPDNSIGFSVFSPPFADLFVYSSDIQDMGNCRDLDSFMDQFGFLVEELMRVTMPGRECAVHCCDLLATKWKDGDIEFKDFSGAIANAFRSKGWLFHSRICIWKDPVTEMQRTKAHGLLYKTLRGDSSKSRVGSADYLLVFRKPGVNPKPIEHTHQDLPLHRWQELASPVWMTVDQGRVLNGKGATESQDERHICPLQLDVIERALTLWSAPDDLVFSPFAGIGSEGHCALQMGRRFVGAELKQSYFKSACANLKNATSQRLLFDGAF